METWSRREAEEDPRSAGRFLIPEASVLLLRAPPFLSSSRLPPVCAQHFFRWQHLSSVFSPWSPSFLHGVRLFSTTFSFPLFPPSSPFYSPPCLLFFPLSLSAPFYALSLDSICSARTSLLPNSLANSGGFNVRSYFSTLPIQHFIERNTISINRQT